MAAPAVKMPGAGEDSSSSDDEELRRCQEAVWETRSDRNKKDGDSSVQQSKRVVVAAHEHDGNELQVSEGFRTHVAKKLGSLLDSCITETQTGTLSCVGSAECDDEDEGFRLFSTSVPGQTADDPPAPVRRRPVPSSSDSDSEMEMRLREAAVSVKDLLPSSCSTVSAPSAEPPCSEKIKKKKKKTAAEGEDSCVVKKKKKKRQNKEDSDSAGSPVNAQKNGGNVSEQEHTQAKVKRKKKKKREGNTEEEVN